MPVGTPLRFYGTQVVGGEQIIPTYLYCIGGPRNGENVEDVGPVVRYNIYTPNGTIRDTWRNYSGGIPSPILNTIRYDTATYSRRWLSYLSEYNELFEGEFYIYDGLSLEESMRILVENWRTQQKELKLQRYKELYGYTPRGYIGYSHTIAHVDDPDGI